MNRGCYLENIEQYNPAEDDFRSAILTLSELLPVPEIQPHSDYETLVFYTAFTLMACHLNDVAEPLFQTLTSNQKTSGEMIARCKWSLG